jgi:ribosomal protein S18 acetylase RimI-like enzyme
VTSGAQTPPAFTLPAALLSQGFALRPESDDDLPFLMTLFATTREDELAPVPWTPEQKAAFLAQQFDAQRRHYRTYFASCAFDVIEHDGEPVGRLYLDTQPGRLHLIDIAFMPAWRGRGVGGAILEALMATARDSGARIAAHVEKFNPALRLYRRLGFVDVADLDVYIEIKWPP